jgi:membrane-associated phospholipid phosphatase
VSGTEREARGLLGRLRQQRARKVAVLLALSVGICIPYFSLQRVQLFPLRSVAQTALDDAIAFAPAGWIWVYLSIALLVPLGPLLATRRDELARYAKGLALLCAVSFVAFLLFPVEGPRPGGAAGSAAYDWIVSHDRTTNSLPSLHAGLAVYSLLFSYRVVRRDLARAGRALLAAAAVGWGILILYSTLATKQHQAVDLAGGILLACAAHAFAWRAADRVAERDRIALTAS